MDPFVISVGGSQLKNWLDASLERKRDEMTGTLQFSVFYSEMPSGPVMTNIKPGSEIQAYVANTLAFSGTIDSRNGASEGKRNKSSDSASDTGGGSRSVDITKDSYRINFTARGKAKRLSDVSHNHKKGYIEKAKPKKAIEELIKGHKVEVDDEANLSDEIPRWFTDGGIISDEIHAILRYSGASVFETPQGKLKIANHGESGSGDSLILGKNILAFSANITEEFQRSIIKIKGNRTIYDYGRKAITDPIKELEVSSVKTFSPYIGQIDGDATKDRLKKAAKNEASSRAQAGKEINILVFHVQTPSGRPWEINSTHYVEVPPENIFDEFVTTGLRFECDGPGEKLETRLTLSPKSSVDEDGGEGSGGGGNSDGQSQGASRRAQAGIEGPSPWGDDINFVSDSDYSGETNKSAGTWDGSNDYPPAKIGN